MQSMIEIDGIILSTDILSEYFCCDLAACRGACCVEGDAGAPVADHEVEVLKREYPTFRQFMTAEGVAEVERTGFATLDSEGELTTPLVGGGRCAYAYEQDGTTLCAIEQAYRKGLTRFCKPVSCHLYPIRVKHFSDGSVGLNYHRWDVCAAARLSGKNNGVRVYQALREPIAAAFGSDFYAHLESAAQYINLQDEA
ncbi:MAG: DUF3109 family protein [Tidjanibacter sp.]|nr:DUF3109 family protein [Tidjanibacter sp.]